MTSTVLLEGRDITQSKWAEAEIVRKLEILQFYFPRSLISKLR